MKSNSCIAPFFYIEVFGNGEVFTCCPAYIKLSIGNIFNSDIEEIWNGETAQKIRRMMLRGDYSCCNVTLCDGRSNPALRELDFVDASAELKPVMPLPKIVKFCHDEECNIRCITCRRELKVNSKAQTYALNQNIEEYYLPLLRNAEKACMNGAGEVLASRHGRALIKAIAENYPHIKFDIHTNGVVCNQATLEALGIMDRLSVLEFSLHSTTRETYEQVCLGSDFEKVQANLRWAAELKQRGKVDDLLLLFVVHSRNYHEMATFAEMAAELDVKAYFWNCRNFGAFSGKEYKGMNVADHRHNGHKDFAETLQHAVFDSPHCHLNPLLSNLECRESGAFARIWSKVFS